MYANEFEAFTSDNEYPSARNTPFSEQQELELAAELLEVSSDAELEAFLGKLVSSAARGISNFARSSTGKAIGGFLKGVAKKALPIAGTALGNLVAPGIGGMIGGKLGSVASSLFELELEGMSPEDQEFEVARRFVRFAGATANAAARQGTAGDPQSIANQAIRQAARIYAPGLLKTTLPQPRQRANSGRWIRQGDRIILLGL